MGGSSKYSCSEASVLHSVLEKKTASINKVVSKAKPLLCFQILSRSCKNNSPLSKVKDSNCPLSCKCVVLSQEGTVASSGHSPEQVEETKAVSKAPSTRSQND